MPFSIVLLLFAYDTLQMSLWKLHAYWCQYKNKILKITAPQQYYFQGHSRTWEHKKNTILKHQFQILTKHFDKFKQFQHPIWYF